MTEHVASTGVTCSAVQRWLWLCALSLTACACSPTPAESKHQAQPVAASVPSLAESPKVVPDFQVWPLGDQILANAALASEQLVASIEQLLQEPNLQNHQATREAWLQTLRQIEPFFVFSLATLPNSKQKMYYQEFQQLAPWPVEAGYLDGFADHPYSGIVFDISTELTPATLRQQHMLTSESDVLLGIYALGTLVFGEHNERAPLTFIPLTELNDQLRADGYKSTDELPRNRRRSLIRLQASLMADDIAKLHLAFNSKTPTNYAAQFHKLKPFEQLLLLRRALQESLTEQILAMAKLQEEGKSESSEWRYWHGQLLMERLLAQLNGWHQLANALPLDDKDTLLSDCKRVQNQLVEMLQLPPPGIGADTEESPWPGIFQNFKQLLGRISD